MKRADVGSVGNLPKEVEGGTRPGKTAPRGCRTEPEGTCLLLCRDPREEGKTGAKEQCCPKHKGAEHSYTIFE